MMIKENKKIMKSVSDLIRGHRKMIDTLSNLLSRNDKVFKITINDEIFNFIPPTSKIEEQDFDLKRYRCIQLLMNRAWDDNWTVGSDAFDDIIALTMGPDPDDLRIEKYEAESYKVQDDHIEDIGTSKAAPLNIENWQVRQELTEDAKNFNPLTRKRFDEDITKN